MKNVSVTQLQDAIARTISELVGCENCSVRLDSIEFTGDESLNAVFRREKAQIRLEVELKPAPDYGSGGPL